MTFLYTWNEHKFVNQLYSNKKKLIKKETGGNLLSCDNIWKMRLDRTWQWEAVSPKSSEASHPAPPPWARNRGLCRGKTATVKDGPHFLLSARPASDGSLLILFWLSEWLFNRWRFHAREKQNRKKHTQKQEQWKREHWERRQSHTGFVSLDRTLKNSFCGTDFIKLHPSVLSLYLGS